MPDDMAEITRRMMEATAPLQRLIEQMGETARAWAEPAGAPDRSAAGQAEAVRSTAERMLHLSEAWIEPVRRLSEEHARFSEEMAEWAQRHREFADQMAEWAEAHRDVAEQLRSWGEPVLRYAQLMSETAHRVMGGMFPAAPDGDGEG